MTVFENQEIPFNKLVDEFEKQRDPSRNPLVQTMFVYQGFEAIDSNLCKLKGIETIASNIKANLRTSLFDLSIQVWTTNETFSGTEYC